MSSPINKIEKGELTIEKAVFFALREILSAAGGFVIIPSEQRAKAQAILRCLEIDPWFSTNVEDKLPLFRFDYINSSIKDFINENELVEKVTKMITIDPVQYVPLIVGYVGSSVFRSVWNYCGHSCRWYKTNKRVVKKLNSLIQ